MHPLPANYIVLDPGDVMSYPLPCSTNCVLDTHNIHYLEINLTFDKTTGNWTL